MGTLVDDLCATGLSLVETHISWVFLGHSDVYKVKKPVSLGFVDFTRLEDRERTCRTEVRLNRRLASDVYKGVVPVTCGVDGRHQFGGAGEVVDWAVHMARLPAEDAADARLAAGTLTRADVTDIADVVAAFHERQPATPEVAQFGSLEAISRNVEDNFAETASTLTDYLSAAEASTVIGYQREFLAVHAMRFEARVNGGRIRDGHGDLRLEHVYLRSPGGDLRPQRVDVIDCIEFSDRFRYADVCADIAFLSMDLLEHNRQDLSEALLARYAMVTNDYDLYGVVDFYESYRAYVRGKVASIVAAHPDATEAVRARAASQARRYFLLAEACARPPLQEPVVIAVGGLIASGKSSLSARVGEALCAPVVEADRVRKHLAGVAATQGLGGDAFAGAYSEHQSERVYSELLRRAEVVLSSRRPVVVDASFRRRAQRQAVTALAERHGVPCLFIECWVPRDEAMVRLARRAKGPSSSDGRAEIYDAFASRYEPVDGMGATRVLRIDTRSDSDHAWQQALADLQAVAASRC